MRNTEKAEMYFRDMKGWVARTNSGDHPLVMTDLADGMTACSYSLRDIYDKLVEMDRKLNALMVGARDSSLRR